MLKYYYFEQFLAELFLEEQLFVEQSLLELEQLLVLEQFLLEFEQFLVPEQSFTELEQFFELEQSLLELEQLFVDWLPLVLLELEQSFTFFSSALFFSFFRPNIFPPK